MPKIKTHSGAKKRLVNSTKRKKACHSHLLTGKTRKRKRQLRKPGVVSKAEKKRVGKLVPYL